MHEPIVVLVLQRMMEEWAISNPFVDDLQCEVDAYVKGAGKVGAKPDRCPPCMMWCPHVGTLPSFSPLVVPAVVSLVQGRGFEFLIMHHAVVKWHGVPLYDLIRGLGDEPKGGWPAVLGSDGGTIKAVSFKSQATPEGLATWLGDPEDATVFQPSTMVGADVVLKSSTGFLVVLTLKLYSSSIAAHDFSRNVATSDLLACYTTRSGEIISSCRARRTAALQVLEEHYQLKPGRASDRFLVRIVVTLPRPVGPAT